MRKLRDWLRGQVSMLRIMMSRRGAYQEDPDPQYWPEPGPGQEAGDGA